MTPVPDQGPQGDDRREGRPGAFVVLDFHDVPREVAVSRGRALELQRAGAGRSLTWVPFDANLGPGETEVRPPQGYGSALAGVPRAPLRVTDELIEQCAQTLPPCFNWPDWDECGPTMKNVMRGAVRRVLTVVLEEDARV